MRIEVLQNAEAVKVSFISEHSLDEKVKRDLWEHLGANPCVELYDSWHCDEGMPALNLVIRKE